MSMKEATIQINDLSIGYHSKNDTKAGSEPYNDNNLQWRINLPIGSQWSRGSLL